MKQNSIVVDLHIEKIAKGYRSFAPADSLSYQMDLFERTLQAARNQKGKKIESRTYQNSAAKVSRIRI